MDSKQTERQLFHMELSKILSFLADLPLADMLSCQANASVSKGWRRKICLF